MKLPSLRSLPYILPLLLLSVGNAPAMTPASPPMTLDQYMASDPELLGATDIILATVSAWHGPYMELKIEERYKGVAKDTITISNSPKKFSIGTLLLLRLKQTTATEYSIQGFNNDGAKEITKDSTEANQRLTVLRAILEERTKLEKAVADKPDDAPALIALGKFQERWNEKWQALQTFAKAEKLDAGTEALYGHARVGLASGSFYDTLNASEEWLKREPGSEEARRLHDQALVHTGRGSVSSKTDLRHSRFNTLTLNELHVPKLRLSDSVIEELQAGDADLSQANLSGTYVLKGTLAHTTLAGANLKDANFGRQPQMASQGVIAITGTDLSHTTGLKFLSSHHAAGAKFVEADLEGAFIRIQDRRIGFPLRKANGGVIDDEYELIDLKKNKGPFMTFSKANLKNAKLRVDGIRVDFSGADLSGAQFELTDLRAANFTDAKLNDIQFIKTVYDCNTKWPVGFDPKAIQLELYNEASDCH